MRWPPVMEAARMVLESLDRAERFGDVTLSVTSAGFSPASLAGSASADLLFVGLKLCNTTTSGLGCCYLDP